MNPWIKITSIVSSVIIVISVLSAAICIWTVNKSHSKPEISVFSNPRVAVYNGCGRERLAAFFVRKLRDNGFDVVNGIGENADTFDYDLSVVIDKKGNPSIAQDVAKVLGIEAIVLQHSGDPYIIEDVAVIIGRDWNTLNVSMEDFFD